MICADFFSAAGPILRSCHWFFNSNLDVCGESGYCLTSFEFVPWHRKLGLGGAGHNGTCKLAMSSLY